MRFLFRFICLSQCSPLLKPQQPPKKTGTQNGQKFSQNQRNFFFMKTICDSHRDLHKVTWLALSTKRLPPEVAFCSQFSSRKYKRFIQPIATMYDISTHVVDFFGKCSSYTSPMDPIKMLSPTVFSRLYKLIRKPTDKWKIMCGWIRTIQKKPMPRKSWKYF